MEKHDILLDLRCVQIGTAGPMLVMDCLDFGSQHSEPIPVSSSCNGCINLLLGHDRFGVALAKLPCSHCKADAHAGHGVQCTIHLAHWLQEFVLQQMK